MGDVLGIADALRRRDSDLEAALAALYAGDQALDAAVALGAVQLVQTARELVHMRIENTAHTEITHRLDHVLGDKQTFGDAGGRQTLVEQHKAVRCGNIENLGKTLALLAQSAQIDGVVLIRRKVREHVVTGTELRRCRRHIDAPLRQHHGEPYRLCDDGFAAAVGSRQDIDTVGVGKVDIIGDDVDPLPLADDIIDSELEVIYFFKRTFSFVRREYLRLADRHALRDDLVGQFRPAHIKEDLGHQPDQHITADVHIFFQR